MSRAGEKLYGDFQRGCEGDAAEAPARRREQVGVLLLFGFVAVVRGSALFGFG